jgi:hypothetical protein
VIATVGSGGDPGYSDILLGGGTAARVSGLVERLIGSWPAGTAMIENLFTSVRPPATLMGC